MAACNTAKSPAPQARTSHVEASMASINARYHNDHRWSRQGAQRSASADQRPVPSSHAIPSAGFDEDPVCEAGPNPRWNTPWGICVAGHTTTTAHRKPPDQKSRLNTRENTTETR